MQPGWLCRWSVWDAPLHRSTAAPSQLGVPNHNRAPARFLRNVGRLLDRLRFAYNVSLHVTAQLIQRIQERVWGRIVLTQRGPLPNHHYISAA